MPFTPRTRRLALIAHVATSVGWLGAVAAFLVLSVVGIRTAESETVRACYVAMDLLGRFLIVPLSLLALAIGVVQSLGTQWGLLRYWWVAIKFALTLGAAGLLLLHQYTAVGAAAIFVRSSADARQDIVTSGLGNQLATDAALAIVVLTTTTFLSILKPWGVIQIALPRLARYAVMAGALILFAVVILHLLGGGMHRH